jgi:two-component system, LytTR family, response regulator
MKLIDKPEIFTSIVVDDEQIAIDHLTTILQSLLRFKIIGKTTFSSEVIPMIKTLNPDLVFLDIQMPGKNGLEILKDISSLNEPPRIIMVTAYDQFVLDAMRKNAFDYLLKPLDPEEINQLIDRLDDSSHSGNEKKNIGKLLSALSHKIQVRGVYEDYFFNPAEILYLEAEGKYTRFYMVSQKPVLSSQNLSFYEKELEIPDFIRISKSHLINSAYLYKTDKKHKKVILKAGEIELGLPYSGIYMDGNK